MNNRSKPGEAHLGLQPRSGEDTFDQPTKSFAPIAPTTGPEPAPERSSVPEPVDHPEPNPPAPLQPHDPREPFNPANNPPHDLGGTEGFIYGTPAGERMVPDPMTGAPIPASELAARTAAEKTD